MEKYAEMSKMSVEKRAELNLKHQQEITSKKNDSIYYIFLIAIFLAINLFIHCLRLLCEKIGF